MTVEGRAFELGDFVVRVGSIMIRQHAVRQVIDYGTICNYLQRFRFIEIVMFCDQFVLDSLPSFLFLSLPLGPLR